MKKNINLWIIILVMGFINYHPTFGQKKSTTQIKDENNIIFKIKPSDTDPAIKDIKNVNNPHLIMYNSSMPQGKLFLFLPGTHGVPERGPKDLFNTAIKQGYRVINLSYIDNIGVSNICKGEVLANDPDCTEKFRNQRVFGTKRTSLISDEPQDAIVNRLAKLLTYLKDFDKKGNWGIYLKNDGSINWTRITVSGQSQGGGMAAFIAKRCLVDKIITFSGGWDHSAKNKIANWYFQPSITPADRWFGTYHIQEPTAKIMEKTYKAMAIPENHIYRLNLEVRKGRRAHGEGIRNIAYKKMWIKILGNGGL